MKPARFDPGALRHRFTLVGLSAEPDGCGGLVETETVKGTLWGQLKPRRAVQERLADQDVAEVRHTVIVRFRSDISSKDRLQLNNRAFEILTLHDPDERNAYLVCETREIGR
ncbi:MAG: phage head closure protein [Pseudomonadota bacterium]